MALVISSKDIDNAETYLQEKKQQSLYNYIVDTMGFSSPKAVSDIVLDAVIKNEDEQGMTVFSKIVTKCITQILTIKALSGGVFGYISYLGKAISVRNDPNKLILEKDAERKLMLLVASNIFEYTDLTSEEKNEFITSFVEESENTIL